MSRPSAPRVWITRPRTAGEGSVVRWRDAGAHPVLEPLLEVAERDPGSGPREAFLALPPGWTLAVTSPRAAAVFRRWASGLSVPPPAHVCVVGEATAEAVREAGFPIHQVVSRATGADLAREIEGPGPVVVPTSALRGEDVGNGLRARGREYLELLLYAPEPRALSPQRWAELVEDTDVVALYSPSAARALAHGLGGTAAGVDCVALGSTTADAGEAVGLRVVARPPDPGEVALIRATLDWWRAR